MRAIACLCLRPSAYIIDFLKSFSNADYHVYLFVDDNQLKILNQTNSFNVIQIRNHVVRDAGFYNLNYLIKPVTSWDKAVYYFSVMNNSYDDVWFFEDDVYIRSLDSLVALDSKYNADLISPVVCPYSAKWFHYEQAEGLLEQPMFNCMLCVSRMSNRLLSEVRKFADKHRILTFLEILFPTLAIQNGLTFCNPVEFENVRWRKVWSIKNFYDKNFLHPVKSDLLKKVFKDYHENSGQSH